MDDAPTARTASERALEILRSRTNWEQRERRGARLGTGPMETLLERLGHPERRFATIHVAGTKGKGSVTWFVDALLRRAGQRTGRYLSPHLERIEERIAVDGLELDPEAFGEAVLAVEPFLEGAEASFFDVLTAAAVHAFARAGVAFAAVETGLGGRLDSTNALPKVSAALTSLGLEHTEILGPDLPSIAGEKAAIARPGVPLLSVTPPDSPEGRVIARAAAAAGAPLLVAGREFSVRRVQPSEGGLLVDVETVRRVYAGLRLPTPARYQAANLALAVAILDDLEARGLVGGVRAALERPPDPAARDLAIPGRYEEVPGLAVPVVLDGAHTEGSLRALLDSLDEAHPGRPRVAVLGYARDKDPDLLSRALAGRVDTVVATRADSARAADPEHVRLAAERAGLRARSAEPLADAVAVALGEASPRGVVVVTGSLYLVGQARTLLVR